MSANKNKSSTAVEMRRRDAYAARFAAAVAAVRRHYCRVFGFWRSCRFGLCRRMRGCSGDARDCLRRSLGAVPRQRLFAARAQLLRATPCNIGAPERKARELMPPELCRDDLCPMPPQGWTSRGAVRDPAPSRRRRLDAGPADSKVT